LKNWKISVFDVIIIAVIIGVGVLFIKFSGGGVSAITGGSQTTVRYTIELTNMETDISDLIKVGDSITDRVEKHFMGRVVSYDVGTFITTSKDLYTGSYIATEVPGRYTANIVIEASATENDRDISVGSFVVKCGVQISVMGPGYAGNGYIIDIERSGS
jgi:hypothetical protein